MTHVVLPPVKRSISVSWAPEQAFQRFTGDFGTWWPSKSHSIGGKRIKRVVFEGRVGGQIFEEHIDGRRFQWGRVTAWDPPQRVCFTWHPSRPEATHGDVELRFEPEGTGTRLELTHSGWERWGADVKRAHRGYGIGWGYVLNVWMGKRTAGMTALDVVSKVVIAFSGSLESRINKAEGEVVTSP